MDNRSNAVRPVWSASSPGRNQLIEQWAKLVKSGYQIPDWTLKRGWKIYVAS